LVYFPPQMKDSRMYLSTMTLQIMIKRFGPLTGVKPYHTNYIK